jgi:F420H(2)-dependent biliverdin reductase
MPRTISGEYRFVPMSNSPANVSSDFPTPEIEARLRTERNVWIATVRPDGRAHLVPIWFVWVLGKFWICTGQNSVKVRNLAANPTISISLENGNEPVIAEGHVVFEPEPLPAAIQAEFIRKYQWDITTDDDYQSVFSCIPKKWIRWNH